MTGVPPPARPGGADSAAGAGGRRSFSLVTEARGAGAVITLHGELDIATCPHLAAALELQSADRRSIVLDMRGVEFLDSVGLRVLLHGRERANVDGLGFELVTSEAVDHTLETFGLSDFFVRRPAPPDTGEPHAPG
jgi:anti-sigma B factor antagonist